MACGMPAFGLAGQEPSLAFDSQKRHIALYASAAVLDRFKNQLAGVDCAKGGLRYARPEKVDFVLLEELHKEIKTRGLPLG